MNKSLFKFLKKIGLSESKIKLFTQIYKFSIVGGISTIIDFVLLYIFKECLNLNTILSNTLSFGISVVYNYIASTRWVFDINYNKSKKIQFILFILFSIIGLILNDTIVYIISDKLNVYYMISKIIATVFVMVFNFVTRKKFLE